MRDEHDPKDGDATPSIREHTSTAASDDVGESVLVPLARLSKDLKDSAKLLTVAEVRYLVDLYYQVQKFRVQSGNQKFAVTEGPQVEEPEPHALVGWANETFGSVERSIRTAMGIYAQTRRDGTWAMSIHGIGPVIAAGLLAHIDIRKAPTVGHIWSFAGLNPNVQWLKGEKRPWNAKLKLLCWKLGQSFMKHRNSEKDFYGKIYEARKALEVERNTSGVHADLAARTLTEKKFKASPTKEAYEAGRLPDGRIELRAERYAVKLFLSHLHHVMYECELGTQPPKPFALTLPDHVHYIPPPNWP